MADEREPSAPAPAVRVLGPVRIVDAQGAATSPPGGLLRRLLVALALAGRDGRSADALVADVWVDDPPRSPRGALQMLVSRARAALPGGVLESTPAGYRLADSDLARAEAPDADVAALELWSGAPAADLEPGELADALAGRAAVAEDALLARRAETFSRAGRPIEALADLAALASRRPLDGAIVRAQLEALRAAGRTAEAMVVFAEHRERLADVLGADPDPALVALHAELLRGASSAETVGLRAATDPLLGREDDVDRLVAAVRAGRLTTITGPGGLGKTRLAHETGLRLTGDFDRIVFVELAGAADDGDVLLVIGSAVGARSARATRRIGDPLPPDLPVRVQESLGARRTLLILDNCEQVVDAVARETADLLGAVPSLVVLTTSRVPLLVRGERVVAPQPLDPIGDGARLFTVRAEAARPGVLLDPRAVGRICTRLDGLPLGIELAAARVRTMSLAEIEDRLDDRFALLVGGDRTAPERHRTLFAVIDWSRRLLAPDAEAALATLAVFPDGFTAASASELLGTRAGPLLEDLVEQSLLQLREQPGATPRFRMLETVREFGLRLLAERGTAADAEAELGRWAVAFALPRLDALTGGREAGIVREVGAEEETLLAVIRARGSQPAGAVVAAFAVLAEWWLVRGDFGTLLAIAPAALPAVQADRDVTAATPRATLLAAISLGVSGAPQGPRALALLRRLARDPALGDGFWPHWVRAIGRARSVADIEREARAAVSSPDPLVACLGDVILSQLLENDGRTEEALRRAEEAAAIASAGGFAWFRGLALTGAAQLRAQRAEPAAALALATRARTSLIDLDPRSDTRQIDWVVGASELALGRIDDARRAFTALLGGPARRNDGDVDDVRSITLAGLAECAEAEGDVDEADRLWGEAVRLRTRSPWEVLSRAGAIAARSARGAVAAGETARLRRRLIALTRLPRDGGLDSAVFGGGLLGIAGAARASRDPGVRAAGDALVPIALRLGARRELPALAAVAREAPNGGAGGERREGDLTEAVMLLGSAALRSL